MRYAKFALAGASAVVVLMGSTAVTVTGQTPKAATKNSGATTSTQTSSAAKTSKVPRTLEGKPDLQGIWSHAILTPLERPGGLNEQYTEDEAGDLEKQFQQERIDIRVLPTGTPPGEKTTDAYNSFWRDGFWAKVPMTMLRTSQVVDPTDGHVPPLTPEAKKRADEAAERGNRAPRGPEDRSLWTRCIRSSSSGPPIIGSGGKSYNNDIQIVQNSGHVVILQEMAHEAQIVPLDGRRHLPHDLHLYKGNSRGHWEGDTLVIDTTNFFFIGPGAVGVSGMTEKAHLVEHYKLVDADNLLYGFTVDDPGTWTKPWSAEFVMWRIKDTPVLPEYACHEGNRSLEYALSGARALEKAAEGAKKN